MARKINPGTLSSGGGLASKKSVEASSFVHPTQGLDGLIAHIDDPSRAHMARAIGLEDAGGYFASDHVEGALQEVASSHADSTQNGVVQGGTYSAAGLVVTMASPTLVLVGGTERDLSASSVTLANNTANWLYVNGTTGALTSATGAAPSITSPEHVLLAYITTSGGAITTSRDARWFVRNTERKLPLTVRSVGSEGDRNSEACFESLDTALLYLSTFGSTGVIRNFTVIIKGSHTVASSMIIPVDGVVLQGEDGCVLTTGASLAPMIDVSGRTGVKIRDITFTCAHVNSTAIGAPSGGALSDVQIERCQFTSGAQNWVTAVDFDLAGPQTRCVIRDCGITASSYGVRMREPKSCRIIDGTIAEAGSAGVIGFHLGRVAGAVSTTADCVARGVTVSGFGTSAYINGLRMKVSECSLLNSDVGLQSYSGTNDLAISNSVVSLDTTTGVTGLTLDGASIRVTGVHIKNPRLSSAYTVEVPNGISVASGCSNVLIANCHIESFYNSVTPGGSGVLFAGTSDGSQVVGTVIDVADTGINQVGTSARFRVSGVGITGARVGINLQANAEVTGTRIELSSTTSLYGIDVHGPNSQISNCRISTTRSSGSYGALDNPCGIYLEGVSTTSITGVDITGFYNSTGSLGSGIYSSGTTSDLSITGGTHAGNYRSIVLGAGQNRVITGVEIKDSETPIRLGGSVNVISGCTLATDSTIGVEGINTTGADTLITGCTILNTRTAWSGQTPVGVNATGANLKVANTTLRGWRNSGGSLGSAVALGSGASHVTIEGCTIETSWNGITTNASAPVDDINIVGCSFQTIDTESVSTDKGTTVRVSGCTFLSGGATAIHISHGAVVEVVACEVMGASATATGIKIEGSDTATTRIRRFLVADNQVQACTSVGIHLYGYVQNGVVSGNTVDCYLPAATFDPTASACIYLQSANTSDLVKNVEVIGNVCLRAQNGIVVSGLDATHLASGVSITGNNVHHVGLSSGGATLCYGISVSWTQRLRVTDNQVYRVGKGINDSDVEGDPTAGANVFPVGIYVYNITNSTVDGNTVTELSTAGGGSGIAIYGSIRDTVSAFDSRNLTFNNNNVSVLDSSSPSLSGIILSAGQTSGGSAATVTVQNVTLSNNQVRRMYNQAVGVSCSGGCTMQQVTMDGNVISTSTSASNGHGIEVSVLDGGSYADAIVRNVSVTNNIISNMGARGVYVPIEAGTTLTSLNVSGNTIGTAADNAILIVAANAPTLLSQVSVDNNNITAPGDTAIYFSITDYSPTDVSVSRNSVSGLAGAATSQSAIYVETLKSAVTGNDLTRLLAHGNKILSTGNGLYVSIAGALKDSTISDNVIHNGAGAAAPLLVDCDPTSTIGAENYVENVIISGNTLIGGQFNILSVDNGEKIRNVSFVNNVVRSSALNGFRIYVPAATVGSNPSVSGLVVESNTFDAITSSAVFVDLGAGSNIDPAAGISISRNHFMSCNTGGTANEVIDFTSFCVVKGLRVNDNAFYACGNADDETKGNISLKVGSALTTTAMTGCNISGNMFEGCSGTAILFADNTAAGAWKVDTLDISRNTITDQVNVGVYVDLTAFSSTVNILVANNLMSSLTSTGLAVGVYVAGSSTNDMRNLSVLDNQIQTPGGVDATALGAVSVVIPADGYNVHVDGNKVTSSTAGTSDIYVSVDGILYASTMDRNTSASGFAGGVYLRVTGGVASSGLRDVSMSRNVVNSPGAIGISLSSTASTSTPVILGLTISDNDVRDTTTEGMRLSMPQSVSGSSIIGNMIRNAGGVGLNVILGDADGVRVDNNTVSTAGGYGISLSAGNLYGCSLSGNSSTSAASDAVHISNTGSLRACSFSNNNMNAWNTGGGTHYGFYGQFGTSSTDKMEACDISHNMTRCGTASSVGIYTLYNASVEGVNVQGNGVYLNNAAGSQSMLVGASLGSSQAGMSFLGNTLRNAAMGVGRVSANFAPDRSICAYNNERTGSGGGGGNWNVFEGYFTNSKAAGLNQD